MKLIKKINNNFVLAIDGNGDKVIVEGKGIGFQKMPCELSNLNDISRTYYNVDERHYRLFNEVDEDIIRLSIEVVDYAKRILKTSLNPNTFLTLADHISFAIERMKKGYTFKFPLCEDFDEIYQHEVQVAHYALKKIYQVKGVRLPKSEQYSIAMNIINSELKSSQTDATNEKLVNEIAQLIEENLQFTINKDSSNYSRFVVHLKYLFKRIRNNEELNNENISIFQDVKKEFKKAYNCSLIVSNYLKKEMNWNCSDEEILYLVLHINRLYLREDCNRKSITSTQ